MSIYNNIETGISTELKTLSGTIERNRNEIAETDEKILQLVRNSTFGVNNGIKSLVEDIESLVVDEAKIMELEQLQKQKKKFVSPYLHEEEEEEDKRKSTGNKLKAAFSKLLGRPVDFSKKDMKKWEDMVSVLETEYSAKNGLAMLHEKTTSDANADESDLDDLTEVVIHSIRTITIVADSYNTRN